MCDLISALYQTRLRKLHGQLSDADWLACRISSAAGAGSRGDSVGQSRDLRELDRRHRALLADTVADLTRIYPDRVALLVLSSQSFPISVLPGSAFYIESPCTVKTNGDKFCRGEIASRRLAIQKRTSALIELPQSNWRE